VGSTGLGATSKHITVVFRYDDPSAKSDFEPERRVIEAFRQHNMCCTFSVIPFVCAGDSHDPSPQKELVLPQDKARFLAAMAQEGVLDIAQHGYSHQNNGLVDEGWSEFASLDYEDQFRKIQKGKRLLEERLGFEVIAFVPPWNSYDANTVKAVEESGFRYVSADQWGCADSSSRLAFLPCTCSIREVRGAVASARAASDPHPVIVVLFDEYDFLDINREKGCVTFDGFLGLVDWLSGQEDVAVVPMTALQDCDVHRYISNRKAMQNSGDPILRVGTVRCPLSIFLSVDAAQSLLWRQRATSLVVYSGNALVLAVCGSLATLGLFRRARHSTVRVVLLAAPAALLLLGSLWTARDGKSGSIGALGMIGALAYLGGALGTCAWSRNCQQKEVC